MFLWTSVWSAGKLNKEGWHSRKLTEQPENLPVLWNTSYTHCRYFISIHFYVSLQEHIWSWYTILFAWVANGVAYQVLQVANKMLAACVTFCILCYTCLFVYKTFFWWRSEILYRTCWICPFAWGRCPMFGRYVVLDGMCTSDLLLFNLPTVCPHCREWYTFSRLWVMDYVFCQYMKDVDVTIYDRIQTYMIYNWFIHQDIISCFCFMFLIVTLDACTSTSCQHGPNLCWKDVWCSKNHFKILGGMKMQMISRRTFAQFGCSCPSGRYSWMLSIEQKC